MSPIAPRLTRPSKIPVKPLAGAGPALAARKAELVAEQTALKAELDTPQTAEITRNVPLSVDDETKNQAHQFLLNAHHEGSEPTGAELGRFLGRSDSLGRRLKRELWPEITNGNGQLKKETI